MLPETGHLGDDYREAGRRVGSYEIVRRVASGGMAEIFLAHQIGVRGITRQVVLKRILPSYTEDPEFFQMFLDEVRIAARLSHPNIAHVYDLGEDRGQHFIVMEYVDGISLTQLLNMSRPDPLPVEQVVEIACELAQALYYAHRFHTDGGEHARIIHRDVSPHNVLLSRDGQVKLVDFGIAKASDQCHRTEAGVLKGKIAYMAPERLTGDPYDHRVDIFSLGAVMHEMLTCSRLFKRESLPQTVHAISREPIPKPSDKRPGLSPRLDAIVMRCLARDPDERYGGADEVAFELETWRRHEGMPCNPILLGRYIRSVIARHEEHAAARAGEGRSAAHGLAKVWSGVMPILPGLAPAGASPPPIELFAPPEDDEDSVETPVMETSPVAARPGRPGGWHGQDGHAVAPPGQPNGPGTPQPWDQSSAPAPLPAPDSDEWLQVDDEDDDARTAPSTPVPQAFGDETPITSPMLLSPALFEPVPEGDPDPTPAPRHEPSNSRTATEPELCIEHAPTSVESPFVLEGEAAQPLVRPPQRPLSRGALAVAAVVVAATLVAVGTALAVLLWSGRLPADESAADPSAASPASLSPGIPAGLSDPAPAAQAAAASAPGSTGTLAVTTSEGDRVVLDDVAADREAIEGGIELPAGDHLVRVERAGREPWSARTTVPAGGVVRLEPWAGDLPDGYLVVNSMPWTNVFVDGERIGATPVAGHPLRPGVHSVTLVTHDDRRRTRRVRISPAEHTRIGISF